MNKAALYKHLCAGFCVDVSFQLLWVNITEYNCEIYGKSTLSFVKRLPKCLPKWNARPPAIDESSCCSTSLSAFSVISILNFDCSNRCAVESYWCFNLHFPDERGYRASSHALVICVSSTGKTAEKIFGILFNQIVHVLLNFKTLYILDNSPSSDASFTNTFPLPLPVAIISFSWHYLSQSTSFWF